MKRSDDKCVGESVRDLTAGKGDEVTGRANMFFPWASAGKQSDSSVGRHIKPHWRIGAAMAASLLLASCTSLVPAASPDTFDLTAPDSFPGLRGSSRAQILILEPSALKILDSENIVIKPSAAEAEYLAKSQWTDRLPKLVQSKLIETFENTERVRAVAKPGDGLVIDYQIVTEIRAFEATMGSGISEARVAVSVKLVSDRTGKVVRTRVFEETVPINGGGSLDIVLGLDAAFDNVARDLVAWTFAGV